MKSLLNAVILLSFAGLLVGCITPDRRISRVRLGMDADQVLEAMGKPFAIRAAKVYEDESTTVLWEYRPPILSLAALTDKYDRDYWILFVNGSVVQYGEPGDFSYAGTLKAGDDLPALEYRPTRSTR